MNKQQVFTDGALAGAWIAAAAIDMAPFILLLIVMLGVSEPLLRDSRPVRRKVSDDEIRVNESNVVGINRGTAE